MIDRVKGGTTFLLFFLLFFILSVFIFMSIGIGGRYFTKESVKQPIFFNHKAHIEAEEMECTDCHIYVEKHPHATIPLISVCIDCHSEPPEDMDERYKEEEEKVRKYADGGKQIPWIKVNRMPGHVYFSHKAHVVWAEMECKDCHRDYTKVEKPVSKPDIHLDMYDCIDCHERKKAEVDCLVCHR